MNRIFSAPTGGNFELTDLCNLKCGHCYNYWREKDDKTFYIRIFNWLKAILYTQFTNIGE